MGHIIWVGLASVIFVAFVIVVVYLGIAVVSALAGLVHRRSGDD